uniref:Uncharacterized protein n=1 Tax=Romanomermis culicivorax TaxID=13658 RepID=A0A915IJF3_ROMCU
MIHDPVNNKTDEACTIRFVHAFIQWQLAEAPLSSKLRGYIMDEDGRVLDQSRKKEVLAS